MRRARSARLVLRGALAALAAAAPASADPADASLSGLAGDDLPAAFRAFRASCPVAIGEGASRPGVAPPAELAAVCRDALAAGELDQADAFRFFSERFTPITLPRPGFLTGYYEPELDGAREPSDAFPTPLLARPDPAPSPWHDRAAIEEGALGAAARPVAYLRDPVDAFVVHVQGSARLRLPAGGILRVAYDGRNGHSYTGIARILAARLGVPPSEMNADRLSAWLRANPKEGRALMRENRSYIFFRQADELDPAGGPVGAAGVQLAPGRSLAVDRRIWSYGLPMRLVGTQPRVEGGEEPLDRLVVAQDTGAAIVGAARGDLFVGSGSEAGRLAGLMRQTVAVTVLWPRGAAPPFPVTP